jgi:hypothetical protein
MLPISFYIVEFLVLTVVVIVLSLSSLTIKVLLPFSKHFHFNSESGVGKKFSPVARKLIACDFDTALACSSSQPFDLSFTMLYCLENL